MGFTEGLGEPEIVTLLFTDLVGSTELLGQLGEQGAEALRRTHFDLIREAAAARSATGRSLMSWYRSAIGCSRSMGASGSVWSPWSGIA